MVQRLDMLIDLVDLSDQVVGVGRRRQVFQTAANFRVAHVFVFDSTGQLLLQRIASGLRHEGAWGSSAAGYLKAGESYQDAAVRKLQEELRVSVPIAVVGKTMMVDQGSQKFISLFVANSDGPFSPNPADISQLQFLSLQQITLERVTGARPFTETFLYLLDYYLRSVGTATP